MQETVYVRTCGLSEDNVLKLSEDLRKWLPNASVYVRIKPCRIVVCRNAIATVINEGDVFSFAERNGFNDVVNHSDKKDSVRVSIEGRDFLIETYVYKRVGDTDNMKYRLTCLSAPENSKDFDDFSSVCNELCNHIWDSVDRRLLI